MKKKTFEYCNSIALYGATQSYLVRDRGSVFREMVIDSTSAVTYGGLDTLLYTDSTYNPKHDVRRSDVELLNKTFLFSSFPYFKKKSIEFI